MAKKTSAQLDREISEFLAEPPLAGTRDVTELLLREAAQGPGDLSRLVASAKPARELTPTLEATLESLRRRSDRSVGFISHALAYSWALRGSGRREHANLIRLIKGGYVHVCEVRGASLPGSVARRDSPFGNEKHYMLHVGSCGEG